MFTIEELKKQLEDGKISKEQYCQMARLFCEDYVKAQPDEFLESEQAAEHGSMDEDSVKKLVQTEIDRATNKLGNEKKKLTDDNQRLQKQLAGKMTDEERTLAEMERQREELLEREASLADKENRLYAVKAIKTGGLDDGSDKSLSLVDFVLAATQEEINANVQAFNGLVKQFVTAEIDRLFKEKGHTPQKGGGAATAFNPYKQETFNVTQQWALETNDPQKAAALKAAAGQNKGGLNNAYYYYCQHGDYTRKIY